MRKILVSILLIMYFVFVDVVYSACITISGISVSGTKEVGSPVTFSTDAENSCSDTIYYRYSVHCCYGSDDYTGSNWQSMTEHEYTTENCINYTFSDAGQYIVVVWAKNDIYESNTGVKIVGIEVEISEEDDDTLDGINIISDDESNSIEIIAEDGTEPHEQAPKGINRYWDWKYNPRLNREGWEPPNNACYITGWGHVFYSEDEDTDFIDNTRIQFKDMLVYYLSISDNRWHQLQDDSAIYGEYFDVFEIEKTNEQVNRRREEEGFSIKFIDDFTRLFHFWPVDRAYISPDDIAGFLVTIKAKLINDDDSEDDDRASARFLLGMGLDYYSENQYIRDCGIGRFKYLKTGWRSFNFCTLSEAELNQTPPPIE